jgi:hypothetical protein
MTDYSDLVQRLREDNVIVFGPDDFINGRTEVRKPTAKELEAADAIEAQAKRIEELEAALKPFVEITEQQNFKDYQYNSDDCVMTAGVWGFKPDFTFKLGDIRQARKVLGEK